MRRRRWGVWLSSAAFHALLVLLFVLDLARKPVAAPPPAMSVWLERAPVSPKALHPSSRGGAKAQGTPAKTEVAPVALPAVAVGPAQPAPSEAAVAAPSLPDLRGLGGGCRLATLDRLSPEARARCEEQLANAMEKGRAPRLNLDPTGRYANDPRPYLTRPPHNGCKPVGSVTNQGPLGATETNLVVGCAKSF